MRPRKPVKLIALGSLVVVPFLLVASWYVFFFVGYARGYRSLLLSDLPPVHCAAFDGDVQTVRRLVLDDPSVLDSALTEQTSPYWFAGVTPLMVAAASGHQEMVIELLQMGADPHATDDAGLTAVDYAQHADIKRVLQRATQQ